ncbi:Gfo/Idh/MocA family protein [Bacillus sp. V33-4]|uniref:Gfo/Idh/MocA family protein n=1 Tax=Bacillus sp. V33-4 TaxID=2054169 RepID=UPI000C763C99|nr:Gfo/Idh/MocA family oxidoreductase [Bacillus sp. V33-4]PLR86234.1 gfo/Idh/MocA family oxidoreductase [Bacillus sp. V33-4]
MTSLINRKHQLGIGIIGLGNAGSALLPSISKHPHVKVTAAAGRNKERLEKFAADFQANYYLSVDDLCRSEHVDAVYIASPTELHVEHVKIAASYKKHIIVEKPLAVSVEEADMLIQEVESAGVHMIVGHSFSFEPPIRKIREIIEEGKLGRVRIINNWYFNDWMYRPRTPEELDTSLGGGVTYRQGSHQFDIIRYIGGGMLRSVRAITGRWDETRPTEGAHAAFLEFEDGTAATAIYNGYDHFHTTELTFGIGEGGPSIKPSGYGSSRKTIRQLGSGEAETTMKSQKGYGGSHSKNYSKEVTTQPFFGLTVVSCERGDIRQSPNGLFVYGDDNKYEVQLSHETGRDIMIAELYDAVAHGHPPTHDGRWGKANLEVCRAVLESAKKRQEVYLSHQVAVEPSHRTVSK